MVQPEEETRRNGHGDAGTRGRGDETVSPSPCHRVTASESAPASAPLSVSLFAQLEVARRELRRRCDIYPRLCAAGKMAPLTVQRELEGMRAIIVTLEQVIADTRERALRG